MEIYLLDSNFKEVSVLDQYNSLLWIDRFNKSGEFELSIGTNSNIVSSLSEAAYLTLNGYSDHVMIIESFNIQSDVEEGDRLSIKGRSLEGELLDRRIIWDKTVLSGNLQTSIQSLLTDAIINPTNIDRKITNFTFESSTDPLITFLDLDAQFDGESLYKAISDICISADIGFKIIINGGNFVFKLYAGVDRSYSQTANPFVVFSPSYDNFIRGDYLITTQYLKNVVVVSGEEGVGNLKTKVVVGSGSGLGRREISTDASGITRNTPSGQLDEADYLLLLEEKGLEELAKNNILEYFDGEISTEQFVYGINFDLGDIVQISDNYGHDSSCRIVEFVFSKDEGGFRFSPTFMKV